MWLCVCVCVCLFALRVRFEGALFCSVFPCLLVFLSSCLCFGVGRLTPEAVLACLFPQQTSRPLACWFVRFCSFSVKVLKVKVDVLFL